MRPFVESRLVSEWMDMHDALELRAELWGREGLWTELESEGG